MTERSLQSSVLKFLSSIEKCKAYNLHGSAWSGSGRPDIIGCYRGVTFVVELKLQGELPTAIQEYELCKWRASGAIAWYATSVDQVKQMIAEIDQAMKGKRNHERSERCRNCSDSCEKQSDTE